MPKRNRIERVPTPEAQGDDSWVEITRPTWGEIKGLRAVRDEEADDIAMGETIIKRHLVGWNWVDDDGNPLPQPQTGDAPLDALTVTEVQCITDILTRMGEQKK